MVPTMSTREVLHFHAALRLGSALGAGEQAVKVDATIQALGLARARDTQVPARLPQARQATCRQAALTVGTAAAGAAGHMAAGCSHHTGAGTAAAGTAGRMAAGCHHLTGTCTGAGPAALMHPTSVREGSDCFLRWSCCQLALGALSSHVLSHAPAAKLLQLSQHL